jgi:hypothetical protein
MHVPLDDSPAPLGHNLPPGPLGAARDAYRALSAFLTATPVIESFDDAKRAAAYKDAAKKTLTDIEAARKLEVEPLKTRANAIDAIYRTVRVPIERALDELRKRLTSYATVEEAKRIVEAERLRQAAAAAEAAARTAETAEKTAVDNAQVGECTTVGEAIAAADAAFAEYQRADRAAEVAARDVTVRLGVPGGKTQTMHTLEKLIVTDANEALAALGLTDRLRAALIIEARVYRRDHGRLPPGFAVEFVRSM